MSLFKEHFVAPLDPRQVFKLRADLSVWLEQHRFPSETAYRVVTVVDELFCNTMEYSGAHWTEVGAELSVRGVSITLRDDGVPFDPFESGKKDYSLYLASDTDRRLGLYLVNRLAAQVDYRRDGDVNEVRFLVEAEPVDPMHPRRH